MPNKLQLLGCFCTSCEYATFLGENIQRVDCVDSFSDCHLAFCCLQNGRRQKAGRGMHGNEATETMFSLQQGTVCSIGPRPTQSQLFDHLQHGKGLRNFYMSDMNC